MSIHQVCVAASYPKDVADRFVDFLARGGVNVLALDTHGIYTAAEVGTLTREDVIAMVCAVDLPSAEAILVPDTAMHSLAWIDDLEAAVGKPVLTANQVTVWEGLRIAGGATTLQGLGMLCTKT